MPLASRADSSTALRIFTLSVEDRACCFKAASPYRLHLHQPPEYCGVGRWIPERLYLQLYEDALRGRDCDKDIASEVAKVRAAAAVGMAACESKLDLTATSLKACEADRNPSVFRRVLWIGAGGLAGAGVGVAGGAAAAAFTDLDWREGLGGGAILGLVAGVVSALIVDALQRH